MTVERQVDQQLKAQEMSVDQQAVLQSWEYRPTKGSSTTVLLLPVDDTHRWQQSHKEAIKQGVHLLPMLPEANYQLMGLQQAAFERKAVLDQQAMVSRDFSTLTEGFISATDGHSILWCCLTWRPRKRRWSMSRSASQTTLRGPSACLRALPTSQTFNIM